MKNSLIKHLLIPETIAGILVIIACSYLLGMVSDMPRASALLPAIVLWIGILLSAVMIVSEIKKTLSGREKKPFFVDVSRFAIAAFFSCIYVPAVHFVGFYTSTLVFIPLVGWIFGYRNKKVTCLVTLTFMAGLYLIFSFVMGKDLPAELLFS